MKKIKIKKVIHLIILLILDLLLVGSFYLKINFKNETIEELLFYINNGAANGSIEVYLAALKKCLPFIILIYFALYSIFYNFLVNKSIIISFKLFKKRIKSSLYPIKFINKHRVVFTIIMSIIFVYMVFVNMKVDELAVSLNRSSDFIENYYIIPKSENVELNEKRNLIYIYVESFENTFFSKEEGGDFDYNVMPELYELMNDKDSIYFSKNELASGMSEVYGTTWTTASFVAQSTGLPFKIPIKTDKYHSKNFMNGAYSIGDILKDKGYYNELISSARTSFGGVSEFFTRHGDYKIIDINSLEKFGYELEEKDKNSWGISDNKMFEMAKDRLIKISKEGKPFNLTLSTIDCHLNDGYVYYYTVNQYDTQYENVYRTESILINNFINWVKQQDFYENTTIVIAGDHLNPQTNYFNKFNQNNRSRFNLIINSVKDTNNTKNRIFTAFDMYPTTLSAMGANIKGNQLGLGIDLFSNKKTLSERVGLEIVNTELRKSSDFYNKSILGKDYDNMIEELEKSGK